MIFKRDDITGQDGINMSCLCGLLSDYQHNLGSLFCDIRREKTKNIIDYDEIDLNK